MEEIQRRPFVRPLFFWITGIWIEICFPLERWSLVLLFPILLSVFLSFFAKRRNFPYLYDARWIGGALIACCFVFLAIQATALAEYRLSETPPHTSRLQEKAQKIQLRVVEKINRLQLSDSEKAVLATMTVNYRQAMTREARNRFSITGVAHLLSVSGFHVAIVCGFLGVCFSFFPDRSFFRWLRYVLMMILMWAFAAISGFSPPAVRATLMLTIFVTGQVLLRSPDKYNTLAAAALLMLVYDPFYLFNAGFQLSFTAVFFILYVQPPLFRLLPIRNPLITVPWGILTVTVAAQIGTFPLCCHYFGQSSTVFLFTNLFLSLIATLLIPLCLIWILLPVSVPGTTVLQSWIEQLTHGMMRMVNRFCQIPGATFTLRFDGVALLGAYGMLFLIIGFLRSKKNGFLFAALFLLLLLLCRQIIKG